MRNDLHFQTGNNDRETPWPFFRWVEEHRAKKPFHADMAATLANAKVPQNYYGPDHEDPARRDSLIIPWPFAAGPSNRPLWLNPPYGRSEQPCKTPCTKKRCEKRGYHVNTYIPGCYDFVRKAAQERERGCETWLLVAARTDTEWFHDFVWDDASNLWRRGVVGEFLKDRIQFVGAEHGAPFPSLLVHFTP